MTNKFLWESLAKHYNQLILNGDELVMHLSKGLKTPYTVNITRHLYKTVTEMWHAMKRNGRILLSILKTTGEQAMCREYCDRGFEIFYKCNVLYLNAHGMAGTLSREKINEYLKIFLNDRLL